jgi:hypothetical protein
MSVALASLPVVEGSLAFGAAGETPAGQPPGRRRYGQGRYG